MKETAARNLDIYDALSSRFAPIEQLFKVMNGVEPASMRGGELVEDALRSGQPWLSSSRRS